MGSQVCHTPCYTWRHVVTNEFPAFTSQEPLSTFGKPHWSGSLLFPASIQRLRRTSGRNKFLTLINIATFVATTVPNRCDIPRQEKLPFGWAREEVGICIVTPPVKLPPSLEWSRGQNVTELKRGGVSLKASFTLNLPHLQSQRACRALGCDRQPGSCARSDTRCMAHKPIKNCLFRPVCGLNTTNRTAL